MQLPSSDTEANRSISLLDGITRDRLLPTSLENTSRSWKLTGITSTNPHNFASSDIKVDQRISTLFSRKRSRALPDDTIWRFFRKERSGASLDESYNAADTEEEASQTFKIAIIDALRSEPLEPGKYSAADKVLEKCVQRSSLSALGWMQDLFLSNLGNAQVASDLLLLISRLPYRDAYPAGPAMALAGLSNKNALVKESAVRAFENWANKESLELLESVHVEIDWLQSYIDDVKADIRGQLCPR